VTHGWNLLEYQELLASHGCYAFRLVEIIFSSFCKFEDVMLEANKHVPEIVLIDSYDFLLYSVLVNRVVVTIC
jgi:hypothetical protein